MTETYKPDGLRPIHRQVGEQCDVCGRRYRTDYLLPDRIWLQISPTGAKEGYLCIPCADYRARLASVELVWTAEYREQWELERTRELCLADYVRLPVGKRR